MNWWEALAPQQSPAVANPMEGYIDPSMPLGIPEGLLADPTQPEPGVKSTAQWLIPPSRVPAAATGLVRLLSGLPEEQALQGELMGGPMVPAGGAGRIGRQGQVLEGEFSAVGPGATGGAPGLPAPMAGGSRPAGGPPPGASSMDEWLAALIGQRGAGPGAKPPGGGNPQGGNVPPGGYSGPGRTSFRVAGSNIPKRLRALLPTWLGGEAEAEELPPIEVPNGPNFLAALGGGGESQFSLPDPIETERQTLPQVDYQGLTEVPYDEALARIEATRPEAPAEQGFLQNLDDWLIPAIAGGLLGGLPGVVLGGLVGEGWRQDNEAATAENYQKRLAQFDQKAAEAMINAMKGKRGQELETQEGIRDQELGNFKFDLSQEEADMGRTEFRDNRALNEMRGRESAAQIDQLRRQRMLQTMMLGGGLGGPDNQSLLTEIIRSNPQLAPIITNMEPYKLWVQNSQEGMGDPLMAEANLSQLIKMLEASPETAPLVQQLKQNLMLQGLAQ